MQQINKRMTMLEQLMEQVDLGMTMDKVLSIMPKSQYTRKRRTGESKDECIYIHWSETFDDTEFIVDMTFKDGVVAAIDSGIYDDFRSEELLSYEISPDFIKEGGLVEVAMFEGQAGTRYIAMYVDNIQILGGSVFLGMRRVHNWKSETEFEITDTVVYYNINCFKHIQRIGTIQKLDAEVKARNDLLLAQQQELEEQAK